MIHFMEKGEPDYFDSEVRQPGVAWIAEHPRAGRPKNNKRPKDFWSCSKQDLQDAFDWLCAYSAMYEPVGTVDHYVSCDADETRAYEWDNYRFAAQWINSSKQTADDSVLDPFEVHDGWFEVLLPSCQMVVTDEVPAELRAKAINTLSRLHLDHDERVVRQRAEWYRAYCDGEINLAGLQKKAPLIARAVEKQTAVAAGALPVVGA